MIIYNIISLRLMGPLVGANASYNSNTSVWNVTNEYSLSGIFIYGDRPIINLRR